MKRSRNSENSSADPLPPASPATTISLKEKVRYSETDQMGVAHNKNYFEWFEIGRTEYCRRKGIPYKTIEERGFYLVVVEAFCRYKKPLRYDDTFVIEVSLKEITPKKTVFGYRLLSDDGSQLLAEGHTTHIVTNAQTEVCRFSEDIIEKLRT